LLSIIAQALLLTFVCRSLSLSLPPSPSSGDAVDGHQWEVQAFSARFHIEPHHRCRVTEEGLHL
jgi:hypothetical protein